MLTSIAPMPIVLVILSSLSFHINFRITLSISTKMPHEILIGIH